MSHIRHEIGIALFGKNLRKLRKSHGFTQEVLAAKAEIEVSQISRIERGIINTSISQLFVLAEALGLHPKELLYFELKQDKHHHSD